MTISVVLLAFWLIAGRVALFGAISQMSRITKSKDQLVTTTMGLMIPVSIVTLTGILDGPFVIVPILFLVVDLVLVFRVAMLARSSAISESFQYGSITWQHICLGGAIGFTVIVSYFNGPLVEQVSDIWWHMSKSAELVRSSSLRLLIDPVNGLPATHDWIETLGFGQASYRLVAILAWLSGASIFEATRAFHLAITLVVAWSAYLLIRTITGASKVALAGFILWLVILGGMNTAFRLYAWPAGLSYSFLNLGLAATYLIFVERKLNVSRAAVLILCCLGATLSHLAELFLLSVACLCLVLSYMVYQTRYYKSGCIVLIGLGGLTLSTDIETYLLGVPISFSICVGLLVIPLFLLIHRAHIETPRFVSLLATATVGAIGLYYLVDWANLEELFWPHLPPDKGYYYGYIPRYLTSWNGDWLRLPRWEHQLRASLLWSDVAALFGVLWLLCVRPGRGTLWMAVLCMAPWLILASPYLFTVLSLKIPEHGVYRVQFLIPAAAIFAVCMHQFVLDVRQWYAASTVTKNSGHPNTVSYFGTNKFAKLVVVSISMLMAVVVAQLLEKPELCIPETSPTPNISLFVNERENVIASGDGKEGAGRMCFQFPRWGDPDEVRLHYNNQEEPDATTFTYGYGVLGKSISSLGIWSGVRLSEESYFDQSTNTLHLTPKTANWVYRAPLFVLILLLSVVLWWYSRKSSTILFWLNRTAMLVTIGAIVFSILPDSLLRIGAVQRLPWAVNSNANYHWQILDRRDAISTHSSKRYLTDIEKIKAFTRNNDRTTFVSDLATTYYVGAETALIPLVLHDHHSKQSRHNRETLMRLCGKPLSVEDTRSIIRAFDLGGRPEIQYFVTNTDTSNYPAEYFGRACVGETIVYENNLSLVARNIYKGEFLSLWKLNQ